MAEVRLESFPFDSKAAGYDDYGYPIYDRAVGASMLRSTFAQFFSNGVFGTPGDALEISKGAGLSVNIAPGVAIINGAMGSVPDGGTSIKLTDESPTVGKKAYSVFLRYDENSDKRSCYLVTRASDATADPQPPAPNREDPGVWELRLGYVVVPTGATDLSGATVMNEKGLEYCPFAAPFEDIDLSTVVADAKKAASEKYEDFSATIQSYYDLIAAALDDSAAAYLQEQIDAIKVGMTDSDFISYIFDRK